MTRNVNHHILSQHAGEVPRDPMSQRLGSQCLGDSLTFTIQCVIVSGTRGTKTKEYIITECNLFVLLRWKQAHSIQVQQQEFAIWNKPPASSFPARQPTAPLLARAHSIHTTGSTGNLLTIVAERTTVGRHGAVAGEALPLLETHPLMVAWLLRTGGTGSCQCQQKKKK